MILYICALGPLVVPMLNTTQTEHAKWRVAKFSPSKIVPGRNATCHLLSACLSFFALSLPCNEQTSDFEHTMTGSLRRSSQHGS